MVLQYRALGLEQVPIVPGDIAGIIPERRSDGCGHQENGVELPILCCAVCPATKMPR